VAAAEPIHKVSPRFKALLPSPLSALPNPMLSFLPWRSGAPMPTTPELLAQLAGGNRAALEPLYRREAGPVYRYALAMCGNPAWAADATQDAFLALVQRPEAVDLALGSVGAWLAGVARHSLARRWRQSRRETAGEDDDRLADGELEPSSAGTPTEALADPAGLLVRAQTVEQVWAALRRLPPPFGEAVVLVDLQGRSYEEAAAIAAVPLNTLRTRLHRGRQRLAALLQEHAP
jgi:RNA polymerase sigma-70 factor, ECF subfamily